MRPQSFLFVSLLLLALPINSSFAFLIENPEPFDPSGYSAKTSKNAAVNKLYQEGVDHLSRKDYTKAQRSFEKSLEKDSRYVNAILGLSEVYFRKKQINQAGAILNEALTRIKDDDSLYLAWGRYLYTQKKFDKAEAAFKQAAALNPGSEKPFLDLGDLYLNALEKTSEAINMYRKVLAINPDNAGAHYALGIALSNLNQEPQEVIEHFTKSSQLEPKNPLPLEALSNAYGKQKNFPKALETLDKLLAAYPDLPRALILKGDIYLTSNETEKALEVFTKAAQKDPKFALAWTKIGMTHQMRQEWDQSVIAYRKSLDINPKQPLVLNNLAWSIFEKKGDLNEALRAAVKANELSPNVPEFLDTLAQIKNALAKP